MKRSNFLKALAGIAITPTILSNIKIENAESKKVKYFKIYNPETFEPMIMKKVEGEKGKYIGKLDDFTEEEIEAMNIENHYK